MINNLFRGVALILPLVLGGCGNQTRPPLAEVESARQLVIRAQQINATEYAPLELRFAIEKLARADLAIENRKFRLAQMLVEQAQIDAELAIARVRAAESRDQMKVASTRYHKLSAGAEEFLGESDER